MNQRETQANANRIQGLDLLRLFAALSVVLFHYGFRGWAADGYTHTHLTELVPFVKYGAKGVSLFFIISGFVIAYSAVGRNTREFTIARIARLYPGFLICMTLTFIVTMLFGMPPITASAKQWIANLFIASPAVGEPFMDGAYWSIVVEITFYAWMAVFIATGLFPRYVQEIVVVWLAISLLNMSLTHSGAEDRILLTNWSGFFAAGLMLFEIYSGRRSWLNWFLLLAATLIAADQNSIAQDWARAHYGVDYSETILAIITFASVALVGLAVLPKRLPISAAVVAALGGLTYPLYLLHQHIGYIIFNHNESVAPAWVLVSGTIVVMLAVSWAIWRYVERPGQRLCKAWLSSGSSLLLRRLELVAALKAPRRV
jgi:peptidoglycan/LPS O-acetylase OafA/YrhL